MPNRIRELRKKSGLTVVELADKLGVTAKHFYDWEVGNRRLHEDAIKRLADIFGVSIDYLLDFDSSFDLMSDKMKETTDEVNDLLDMLHKRPEMKMLFSLSKKATREDIEKAVKIIEALKEGESTCL